MAYIFIVIFHMFALSAASKKLEFSCCKNDFGVARASYYSPEGKCIVVIKEQKTWDQAWVRAQQIASAKGFTGKLLSIPNDAIWQFVVAEFDSLDGNSNNKKFGDPYWIALKAASASQPNSEGDFKWYTSKTTPGSTFAIVKYDDGQSIPHLFNENGQLCVRITDDGWWDRECSATFYSFAEITDSGALVSSSGADLELGDIRYSHSGATKVNWFDAFKACRSWGGVVGGSFDSCYHTQLQTWANGKSSTESCWSNFAKNGGSYTMLMDEYGCNTLSSHSLTAGSFSGKWLYTLNPSNGKLTAADENTNHCYICMKRNCVSTTCQNGGVCFKDPAGTEKCSCPPGFHGTLCQTAGQRTLGPENAGFCQSIATTTVATTVTTAKPVVAPGACDGNPCINNSTCKNKKYNKYTCFCQPGYGGKNCHSDIDECTSNPCLNKGTCSTPVVNSYKCDCLTTFTGEICETSLTTCDLQEKEELRKRVAMVVTWSFSSSGLMIMLGVLLILFLILLDFSLNRLLHMGQELSLLAAHIIAIFGRTPTVLDTAAFCDEEASGNPPKFSPDVCRIISVSLHYLFLVHFSFILLEAIHNYTVYTYVTVKKPLLNRLKAVLLGLLTPAIPVLLTASIHFNSYTHEKTCWLNFNSPNFWGEFVPAILLIPPAVIMSEAAGMRKFANVAGANEQQRTSAIANSHGILILGPLSMAAWLIGALGVDKVDVSLYTIASTLNIILGVCFVVFHTVGNEKARAMLKKLVCCRSKEKTTVKKFAGR